MIPTNERIFATIFGWNLNHGQAYSVRTSKNIEEFKIIQVVQDTEIWIRSSQKSWDWSMGIQMDGEILQNLGEPSKNGDIIGYKQSEW